MTVFHRAVTVLALVVVAACGAQVTNVKLDTAAPLTQTPTATHALATVLASQLPVPTQTTAPTASTRPSAPIVSIAGPSAWRSITTTGPAPSAREDHTWTVDANGDVAYLFGGRTDDGPSDELWAFDLAAYSWARLEPAGASPQPRFGHTATWVDGMGLVVWSGQGRDGFFADLNVYNPTTNTWTELSSLGAAPDARYGSCASLGPDGELWISHGFTAEGRFSDTRSYEFTTGTWTDRTPVGEVPIERCLHDCFWSADRLILYGGQTNGVAALGDIWAYDLVSGAWMQGPEQGAQPRQLYALADGGDSAFVFGGGSVDGSFLADTLRLDTTTLELSEVPRAGEPGARSGATLVLDPARAGALLFGGQNADGLMADMWELFASP